MLFRSVLAIIAVAESMSNYGAEGGTVCSTSMDMVAFVGTATGASTCASLYATTGAAGGVGIITGATAGAGGASTWTRCVSRAFLALYASTTCLGA